MSDADDKLAAFWASTEAPAHDAVFAAQVLAQVSRRRAVWRLAAITVWSMAAGVALWSFAPMLETGLTAMAEPLAMAVGAASLGWIAHTLTRRRALA